MLTMFLAAEGLRSLLFPFLLLAWYMVCWLRVGRDPKIEHVTPLYQPPPGVSPGVARYILTGGSDGTTLAAVLAHLAAQNVIALQPQGASYKVELLQPEATAVPEEAAVVRAIFSRELHSQPYAVAGTAATDDSQVAAELRDAVKKIPTQQLASRGLAIAAELAAEPRQQAIINPRSAAQIELALAAIQKALRKNLQGVYFRGNFVWVFIGIMATFVWGLGASAFINSPGAPPFLALWLLLFTTLAGIVFGATWTSRPARPNVNQRLNAVLMPLLFFALPGFLIGHFAMPGSEYFILALLLSVALNSMFLVLMRAPTEAGRKALQDLAGFREFLVRVEQDRLERMNTPEEKARLMNQYLPYAIALEVKEGWGDTMAAAFSNAVVER